ncbi:MAG: GNAT family N-acetyltransferase [Chloroflexi bacterium]|nr:GNAT family N-acetyltransferase [Chloroflexota bacterium]
MNAKADSPEAAHAPLTLRRAERADAPALLRLIVALAEFEKLPPPEPDAQRRLIEDGFGERPRFEAWLAFCDGVADPVGYALFFDMYSSFLARPTLFLEDVFVLPAYRRRGIGGALLRQCIRIAHERGCGRMEWACLDWNSKAQEVYKKLGARQLSEWFSYRLTREGMEKALSKP